MTYTRDYPLRAHFCEYHLRMNDKYSNLWSKVGALSLVYGIPAAIAVAILVNLSNILERLGLGMLVVVINHIVWMAIGPSVVRLFTSFSREYKAFQYYWRVLGLGADLDFKGLTLRFANPSYAAKFVEANPSAKIVKG